MRKGRRKRGGTFLLTPHPHQLTRQFSNPALQDYSKELTLSAISNSFLPFSLEPIPVRLLFPLLPWNRSWQNHQWLSSWTIQQPSTEAGTFNKLPHSLNKQCITTSLQGRFHYPERCYLNSFKAIWVKKQQRKFLPNLIVNFHLTGLHLTRPCQ